MNHSKITDYLFNAILISNVDATSITVPNLAAGAEYVFNITAENRIGSSSILCGPTSHKIGEIESNNQAVKQNDVSYTFRSAVLVCDYFHL